MSRRTCEAVLAIAKSLEAGDRSLVLAVKASEYGLDINLADCDSPIALMRLSLAWRKHESLTGRLTTTAREMIVTSSRDPSIGKFMNDLQRRAVTLGLDRFGNRMPGTDQTDLLTDTSAAAIMKAASKTHDSPVHDEWAQRYGIPYLKFFRARSAQEWNGSYPNKSIKAMVVNIEKIIGKHELVWEILKHMPYLNGPLTPRAFVGELRERER